MAKNDLILLDSLLEKKKAEYPTLDNIGSLFDHFVFDNILKDYDLSYEEIERGWVDGGDDGGIDGFFILLDGLPIADTPSENTVRKHPEIEVIVITCKHEATFRQIPLNNLLASLNELFDLSRTVDSFHSPYNEALLEQRNLFSETFKELSARQPAIKFTFFYASRGDAGTVAENVVARAELIKSQILQLFSVCNVSFKFYGASELLQLSRKQQSLTLRLNFIENYVSRAKSNYIVLCALSDYYRFITDEEGMLRTYLFESNVRDYLGSVPVNEDISQALLAHSRIDQCDFWWLNNGVTIIATAANVAGKEISLENIQIVNGLQTTETIFNHFKTCGIPTDDRAVLVKIIVTQDPEVRDKIIKATNYQTGVELSSLRATEKIQRDIEEILLKDNWFYDRRKNYYKNQGRPAHRIISPSFLASCITALVHQNPAKAAKLKTKFMRIDEQYNALFSSKMDIRIYSSALSIVKAIEYCLYTKRGAWGKTERFCSDYRWLFSYAWAAKKLRDPDFKRNDLIQLHMPQVEATDMDNIWRVMGEISTAEKFNAKRLHRNQLFLDHIKTALREGRI